MLFWITVLSGLWLVYWYKATRVPKNFPPGPRYPLPVLGDLHLLGSNLQNGLRKFRSTYGDIFGFSFGPRKAVVLNNYDLVQEAFSKADFAGRPLLKAWEYMRQGTSINNEQPGVLYGNGKTWHEQRRFTLTTLRDFGFGKESMEELIEAEAAELVSVIAKHYINKPTDVQFLFNINVLSSLWRIVAGKHLDHFDPELRSAMNLLQRTMNGMFDPVNNILYNYPTLFNLLYIKFNVRPYGRTFQSMLDLCGKDMKEHLSTYQDDATRDFIDAYIKHASSSQEGSSFHKKETFELNLKNTLMDIFIAGSETTSTTLSWAVLFMILNPDVQKKVQDEMDEVFGRERNITIGDRSQLEYTNAAIHEIHRRANIAAAGVPHGTVQDTTIGGYFIPKGTTVMANLSEIMHDPVDFPQPYEFRPERFIDKDTGKFKPHPRVIPFSLGKRRCLGEKLARESVYCFLTNVLHRFTLEKAHPEREYSQEPNVGITLTPKYFEVVMRPRDEHAH